MQAWFRFILRHRIATLAIVLGISVFSAWYTSSRAVIATSLAAMFMGDNPDFHRFLDLAREFSSDEVLIWGFKADEPLALERIEAMQNAIDAILELEDVQRVDSIYNAQEIRASGGMLKVKRYARAAEDEPDKTPEVLAALQNDEYIRGTLLSADARHIAIVVELTPNVDRPAERGPELIKAMLDIFEKAGIKGEQLHKAGMVATVFEVIEESKRTLTARFPFIVVALLLVVFVLFRALLPVFVTGGVSVLAISWTVAFSVFLNPEINVMLAMVPAVVMIVGFSDVVHLYSAYLLELGEGHSQHDAIIRSASDVGRACLYTSMTTFVGFMCLSLVPTPMFRQLGIVLGFGVAVALLIAVTAMPVLLSLLPAPDYHRWSDQSRAYASIDRVLAAMRRFSTDKPVATVAMWAVVLAVSLYGISVMNIDADMQARMAEDNVVRVDQRYFERHFSGSALLEVYVHSSGPGQILEADAMKRVAAFQDAVVALEDVDTAMSLVDLMRRIHHSFADAPKGSLPTSREAFAQYLLLFEMGGGSDLSRVIDFDRKSLRIAVRMNTTAFREARRAGGQVRALAAKHLGPDLKLEVTGGWYLMGSWLDEILAGQAQGLALSFAIIAFMMMFVARSVRVGLWSMLPNMLPLLTLGGYVGLAWDPVDSDTLAVAMLAIGIGVDDTIHFVSRYRVEAQRAANDDEAISRTFLFAGRAIVMTTAILVIGFLPNATSDYFSTKIMGTMLPMTLVVALLADLMLVPALIKLGPMRIAKSPELGI